MTLYEILNLEMDSSAEKIQDAYSKLLAQYSRDAASGNRVLAEKKIADLKYAKKILLDPNERKNYDAALQADLNLNNTRPKVNLEKHIDVQKTSVTKNEEHDIIPPVSYDFPQPRTQVQHPVSAEKSDKSTLDGKLTVAYILKNAVVFTVLVVIFIIINAVVKA